VIIFSSTDIIDGGISS